MSVTGLFVSRPVKRTWLKSDLSVNEALTVENVESLRLIEIHFPASWVPTEPGKPK
jgi:hypothetical protein